MDVNRKHSKTGTTLRLSGECTIYHVSNVKDALLGDCKGFDKTVQLQLEQISEIDTAGVQLLLMLQKVVQQAGGQLQLQSSNDTVNQVLRIFNLPAPLRPLEVPG